MKKIKKIFLYTLAVLLIGWGALTWVVERPSPKKSWNFINSTTTGKKVLIVFDPDPFYNLDEQVCLAIAQVFSDSGFTVKVTSVLAANESNLSSYDAYVFCANTYNWSPDWAVTRFIKKQKSFNKKPVASITLGAGSTMASQKKLEHLILSQNGTLINSRSLWLARPNDESRMKESNITVALSLARTWAATAAQTIHNSLK